MPGVAHGGGTGKLKVTVGRGNYNYALPPYTLQLFTGYGNSQAQADLIPSDGVEAGYITIPQGEYRVLVTPGSLGYVLQFQNFLVQSGDVVDLSILIAPTFGSLTLYVDARAGAPAVFQGSGWGLQAYDPNGTNASGTFGGITDQRNIGFAYNGDGVQLIYGGLYRLTVAAAGCNPYAADVTITPGLNTGVNVTLTHR
jgi:hypothetical protein